MEDSELEQKIVMLNSICLNCKQEFVEQQGNSLTIFKCGCGKDIILNNQQKRIYDELLYGFSKTLYLNGLIKNVKYRAIIKELKEDWGNIQEFNRLNKQEQLKIIFGGIQK